MVAGSSATTDGHALHGFDSALVSAVSSLVQGRIKLDLPAASITTLAVGGPVRALVTVESVAELQKVLALLSAEQQTVYPFGFGSNVLVGDAGLEGWVIRLGGSFRDIKRQGSGVTLDGGVSLMSASRKLSEQGLSGIEFASGIPASIGGAVFMNAGAHGGEMASCVAGVTAVLPDGTLHEWSGREVAWSYRSSGLPCGAVIVRARVELVEGDPAFIAKKCADNVAYRRATQPLSLPSAGSIFKNPSPEVSAGFLLEQAGLKGVGVGGALVSAMHANWIVNPDKQASAADVLALIKLCSAKVLERSGVVLQPELKLWR